MNCNIYVYGDLRKEYSQYPDNHTRDIIKGVFPKVKNKGKSQVVIRRNEDLIYLIYNYNYYSNRFFGFCLELNKVCPLNINYVFNFFGSIVEDLLNNGDILHYNTNGDVQASVDYLYQQSDKIDNYSKFILLHFNDRQAQLKRIPPINRTITSNSSVVYQLHDPSWSVEASLTGNNTIIITKEAEIQGVNSYKSVLNKLNDEKREQIKINQELQRENAKLRREKKRVVFIIILSIVILLCGVGLFFLNDNLNKTQGELVEANDDIKKKKESLRIAMDTINSKDSTIIVRNKTISSQKEKILLLNDSILYYKTNYEKELTRRQEIESKYDSYKSTIANLQPLIVKSTSFDFSSGNYKINYYGLSYGRRNVTFRVICPDNTTKTFEKNFYVTAGSSSETVTLSNSFDRGKFYTIEIMYNNRVIGGSRH